MQEKELKNSPGEIVAVSSVSLHSFRNYESLDLSLSPSFNVLAGRNGQGKTNFLEALYFVSTTRLLRGQRDQEAIREGDAVMVASVELSHTETQLSIRLERGLRKKSFLNGVGLPRASDLLGRCPCVSVSSADMEIVRGEPADRRLFLDLELSALYPSYLRHFTHYKRALEQRNAVLKQAREVPQPSELYETWEEHLAEHGSSLRKARRQYVDELRPGMTRLHSQMGEGEMVEIGYAAKDDGWSAEGLRQLLSDTRHLDIARGVTQIGPHRDDLQIDVVGREARLYGSQGQQRTAVLALKMASLEVATRTLGAPPLLLLDDILSDLDERRRALLIEVVLENAGQVVLTCTEASAAGPKILDQARVFHVQNGSIS
jgi:DNA replication and repair protein RecF